MTLDQTDATFLTAAFRSDPWATYRELSREWPVYFSTSLNQWIVTGRDAVAQVLADPGGFSNYGWELARIRRFSERDQARLGALERMCSTPVIVFSDPPEHTRLRGLVSRGFSPRIVDRSREWVVDLVADLVSSFSAGGSADLVRDLSNPLPVRVIARLFGAPTEDAELYKQVSTARVQFQGSPVPDFDIALKLNDLLIEFRSYLEALVARLAANPDDGLLSSLIPRTGDTDGLTPDELFHTCVVFLSAGHETTSALINGTLLALLTDKRQLSLLRADRSKITAVVNEGLRWVTPVQRVLRIATRDCELSGQRIPAGSQVVAVLASANHDAEVFSDPDAFRLERERRANFAFGQGIHTCIGAALGRAEASIVIDSLLDIGTEIAIPPGWTPRWVDSISLRSLTELPVVFGPAADLCAIEEVPHEHAIVASRPRSRPHPVPLSGLRRDPRPGSRDLRRRRRLLRRDRI
jgi:pimeloyl-[acyl-carrier protein] synthase